MNKKIEAVFKGSYTELLLAAECVKRGWGVSVPFSDILPYDLILDNGHKLLKIQVKTAYLDLRVGNNCSYKVNAENNQGLYRNSDIDFFAFFIAPDVWFILPVQQVQTPSVRFYLDKPNHKLEIYKNAWHLLK